MVGDPGIEPGVGLPGGVTVRCRTLQHVARRWGRNIEGCAGRQGQKTGHASFPANVAAATRPDGSRARKDTPQHPRHHDKACQHGPARARSHPGKRDHAMKKPAWVIDKERGKRAAATETVWLFGLHAVRDALLNPAREKLRLLVTRNAADRLAEAIASAGITPEIADARRFPAPLAPDSVHQGAALEVRPLNWGKLADRCATGPGAPLVVLLDRVTDPHNVGAVLRSAEVFG